MTEKPKTYFGFLPKDQLDSFFAKLKSALGSAKKEGEHKEFEFEIKGAENPQGISFETLSFDKTKFTDYCDPNAEHVKKALWVASVNLELNDEKDVPVLEGIFTMLKPMFDQIPQIAEKPGKYELHFRKNGKKVSFDLVNNEGKLITPLLDLGLDLSEFHKFNFAIKTGVNIANIFDPNADQNKNVADALGCILQMKSSSTNVKYICGALIEAIKDVKFNDEALQKKFEKILGFINLIYSFVGCKLKLEYDSKFLADELIKELDKNMGGQPGAFNAVAAGNLGMVLGAGKETAKPMIEQFGALDVLKGTNLDFISISASIPKYQNGVAFEIRLPGLSKVINELLA